MRPDMGSEETDCDIRSLNKTEYNQYENNKIFFDRFGLSGYRTHRLSGQL